MSHVLTRGAQKRLARKDDPLLTALDRLHSLEREIAERLTRVEENLHLLRQDLLGNGQPGRLHHLEMEFDRLRAESERQRGVLAGMSLIISTAIAVLSQFLFH